MNSAKLFRELEARGKIKKQGADAAHLNGLWHAAGMNFRAALDNLPRYPEVAFKAAYDGLLQTSRVLMLAHGYRPDDGEQHKTTFLVAGAFLGDEFKELLIRIDKYRKRRNECLYDPIDTISSQEATAIIETAKTYKQAVKRHLKGQPLQLELFKD